MTDHTLSLESNPIGATAGTRRLKYDLFYRKYGMRFIQHVKDPIVMDYNQLILPFNSVLHWADYERDYEVGPPQTEGIIDRSTLKVFVESVEKYPETGTKPGYMQISKPVLKEYMALITANPKYLKSIREINEYGSQLHLPLVVYGLLDKKHRYKNLPDSKLNHWSNYWYTVFDKILQVGKTTDKHQFVEMKIPREFPTINALKLAESGLTRQRLNMLRTPDVWWISTFWNLISQNGNAFPFQNYELKDYAKVNIILRIDDKCVIINLGNLIGFAYGEQAKLKPSVLRLRFVNMLINLQAITNQQVVDEFSSVVDNDPTTEETTETENEDINDLGEADDADDADMDSADTSDSSDNSESVEEKESRTFNVTESTKENTDDIDAEVDSMDDQAEAEEEQKLEEALEIINDEDTGAYKPYTPVEVTPETVLDTETDRFVKAGIMSVANKQRLMKLSQASMNIKSPIENSKKTIGEDLVIPKEDIVVEEERVTIESNDILDESMKGNTLNKLNETYIEKVMQKDILNAVMGIQKGGVVIKDYTTEKVQDINDNYTIHKVQIETVKGHTSTLSFRIPNVSSDGTFISSGSKRYLRSQVSDVPIRKVSASSVALTSYYSKMFVNRSERKQFSAEEYIHNHIVKASMEKQYGITKVKFSDVLEGSVKLPRIYSIISKKFSSITINNLLFNFDYNEIENIFGRKVKTRNIPLAINPETKEIVYWITNTDNPKLLNKDMMPVGTLEALLGLEESTIPLEYAEVSLYGKAIPLGLLLGYHLGFGNLLKTLKINPRREAKGKRLTLSSSEYAIKFNDETLVFDRKMDPKALLIINGFLRNKNYLRTISVYDLDHKAIYTDLVEDIKAPIKLIKESKDMFNLWVDHITKLLLEEMGEPTDLVLLFIRAAELLESDQHPDAMDGAYMRHKGYERVSGIIYGELTKAIREYNSRPVYNNTKLTINPESIWFAITTDQTQELVRDSNPIHNLKEKEVLIYSGAGGRSGQTMMAGSRKYHKSSLGIIGEATVDSGDAGTTIYRSANPKYNSVYGTANVTGSTDGLSVPELMTTSFCLAPGAHLDDPKRASFVTVQNSQTTFCDGYSPMPFRTGMEKTIHHKSGKMFSKVASKSGTVVSVNNSGIIVQYDDGTKEGFEIGRLFGKWDNYSIPHDLVANVKAGQKFKAGDCLYYNKNYFQVDPSDNDNITFKNHTLARVAFVEGFDVYEDSCAMSTKFTQKLTSRLSHIRNIRINTDNTIKNLVEVGSNVNNDSILCTIHSAQIDSGFFSDDVVQSLEAISTLNPKADYKGVVDKIQIIYTADIEEMDEELADLVRQSDARIYRESKKTNGGVKSGRVKPGFMVDGKSLTNNEVVIQVFITETTDMSTGDKVVISNQLKSTVGRYWSDPVNTEDGEEVDILFGANSIDNRIVLDAELIGTTNALLVALTDEFIKTYDKK